MVAFLTVFQLRNITVEELQGFRDALQQLSIKVDNRGLKSIDLCGTGGDGKDTFNISTLASFIVAGSGEKVTKHGNYGVSSSCGSSNILEYFGYSFSNKPDTLHRQLDRAGICFLHAPLFNPAMKNIAPIRKELAMKTFFNMLGPMVNPMSPSYQLAGVFDLELARIYSYIYQNTGISYSIVHSLDGYDEISLTGNFKIFSPRLEAILSPSDLGLKKVDPLKISGGASIKESAKIFTGILSGKGSREQSDVVIANAGLALKTIYPDSSYEDCIATARESLLSGRAEASFKKLMDA